MLNYLAELRYKTQAILSGVTDVILINHNGDLLCSPFNLRFGKFFFLNATEELQTITYNLTSQVVKKRISLIHINIYVNEKLIHVPFVLDDEFQGHFLYHNLDEINELKKRMKLMTDFEEQIQLPLNNSVLLFNVPTKNILKSMNLKYGINDIRYEIECQKLGKKSQICQLYMFSAPLKFFISDIDGTITKSPAIGLLLTTLGQDYTQEHICKFYNLLQQKGYVIIYSSARSMIQYDNTKSYLLRQEQDGLKLPLGPIFLSPSQLMDAFTIEMIKKSTDILKSKMLELFKQFTNDQITIGGMGDRSNDIVAYKNIGIQTSRILLINRRGEIIRMVNEDKPEKFDSIQILTTKIDEIF